MIRAIPCASYRPDRRELLPWPGAPPTEPGASVRTAGGSNPMQSGQDPMHQCAGGPGLHARSIERPGRAALILAYSTHPTCPVEGSSFPSPGGFPGRTGHTTRSDREFNPMQSGQNPMHQCHPGARPGSAPAVKSPRQPVRATAAPPTLAEARKRLAAARGGFQPWLTSAAAEVPDDVPEVMGSQTYRKV
jgi:hypothetical protein